jgi:hypothetical protein
MQTFLQLLPLAVALALSTVPILAALLILLSPNRSRSAIPFLLGWMIGMFLVAVVATLAATQFVPASRLPRRSDETIGMLEIAVGAGLVLVGVFSAWRTRRRPPADRTIPSWLRRVETLGPFASFGIALLLNLRPKSLLLAAAAGLTLRADVDSTAQALIALAIYTVVGASTVAVPIVASALAPERMEPRLVSGREWLVRYGELLTSAIVLLVGVIVVVMGAQRL